MNKRTVTDANTATGFPWEKCKSISPIPYADRYSEAVNCIKDLIENAVDV